MPKIFLKYLQPARMLNMKGTRLIVLILSILLLTISSGLLFYKNLFLMESPTVGGKIDFEELRYTDLQINSTVAGLRKNLSTDTSMLKKEITRVKELMDIVSDVNKNTSELNQSIVTIQKYFDQKITKLNQFQEALADLKYAVGSLNYAYSELAKNNIKFVVDKRDFYRECIIDALFYVTLPSKDNEARLMEDKKILGQVISFANAPNPYIQKFNDHIDTIYQRTTEIDRLSENFNNDNAIASEMSTVGKYFQEMQVARSRDGEIFLTMVFGAIVLYLISVVVILKKLT